MSGKEVGNYILPTAGIRVIPFEHFYVSANLLNGSTTLLSSGIVNAGIGFKTHGTDLWLGYGAGPVDGEKILLALTQKWHGIRGLVTASVLTDVSAQAVGPLRPGDWGDIGLALHFPLGIKASR